MRESQRYYILRDKIPVEVDSLELLAKAFGEERHIASTEIPIPLSWYQRAIVALFAKERPVIWVSTVFLAINHQFGDGPPLLFETMIFDGAHDGWQARCSTYGEALAQHEKAVAIAQR